METSPKHDERVMRLVAEARRQSPAEREAFLRVECETDSILYQEVADTLNWDDRMGSFLQAPLIKLVVVARPFQTGEVIDGRFEIVRIIGEGGMGVVYEAIDRKRNLRIAIKSAKPGFQRLLSPELEGALRVRHPNICLVNQIHSTKTDKGDVDFLSMEFLQGETLAARLDKSGKLDAGQALNITRQLCAGLSEAHRSGIIHGDLKSSNIILCQNEDGSVRPVITDFGLARGENHLSGEVGGTPDYMAPELWRGQKTSKASDVYALGIILYEIVTGRLPFDSTSVDSRLIRPPAPSTLAKGLDPRWDRVVLDCLSESPAARPADAGQVIARLEKHPLRKAPLIAVIALAVAALAVAASIPPIHAWVIDLFMPVNMRLAILPFQGPHEATVIGEGALQDVSDRLRHMPSARRTLVVISPAEEVRNRVQTPQEASKVLHATHALQTSVRREGDEYIAEASVIDLATLAHVGEFSAHYSDATIGALPSALAGEVSLALHLLSAAVPEALSPEATAPYDKGLYLLRNDRSTYEDAIVLFREAARLDPRSPLPPAALVEALIIKCETDKESNCLDEAKRALREAESLNPDSARVRLADGMLNQAEGQDQKALEDYRRVLELEPRNVGAYLRTARAYDKSDMPGKAIEAYKHAIELDPGYFEPYEELGLFYYYRGRYPEAAEQFKKAIERAPGMADAYTSLGAVLGDLGRYAEGEQALLASLKIKEAPAALNDLGAMRVYQRRDADAVPYFNRAIALDPSEYLYLLNLGDSAWRLRRFGDANAAYRKAMDLALEELKGNPRLGRTRAFVAYFAARLGDKNRAEQEIGQALQLSPGDNKVKRRAVLTYETLHEREHALAVLETATAEMLHELDRQPDLADFRQDPRFQQLVNKIKSGGK
jgi:serine/threonine protein kinase/tetratricopeptide (TPR) repeat protein